MINPVKLLIGIGIGAILSIIWHIIETKIINKNKNINEENK